MSESANAPAKEVEAAREAFEREFERFARFIGSAASSTPLTLSEAEGEQRALSELRTRHLGKKSPIASAKKLIGRVPADERASFGQLVQKTEAAFGQSLNDGEAALKAIIEAARTARDTIDVTIPGRRPRQGTCIRSP